MTWKQTASGRMIDLLNLQPEEIDWRVDIAGPLARSGRFDGHIRDGILSIAQHQAIGAAAILRDTGDRTLAAHFLIHDAHEAYCGDITKPAQEAIVEMALRRVKAGYGRGNPAVIANFLGDVFDALKERLDAAIIPAAGLRYPVPPTIREAVKAWDARMLETERKLFLGPCARPWAWDDAPPVPIRWPEKPRLWPWPEAEGRWLALLADLCPKALAVQAA